MTERRGVYQLSTGVDATSVCTACRGDQHEVCSYGFEGILPEGMPCCCAGEFAPWRHQLAQAIAQGIGLEVGEEDHSLAPTPPRKKPAPVEAGEGEGGPAEVEVLPAKEIGDSGYIHPAAWNSTSNIGELRDPASTGRKRAKEMFTIPQGYTCEWAGKKNCGGGIHPIMGCIRNPAQDIHHGPDKSTLNNAKVTWDVGVTENVHLICSFCHSTWHARNNGTYPKYDRVEQQAQPWLPFSEEPWPSQVMVDATIDELIAEETRRREEDQKNGRATGNGRAGRRGEAAGVLDDDESELDEL